MRPEKLLATSGCKSRRGKWTTPRSRLQREGEIPRAKRSVESPLSHAGSKHAARNASEPPTTPRQIIRPKGLERPSRACRGEGNRLRSPRAAEATHGEDPLRTLPGYRGRDAGTVDGGTGETLLDALEWEADAIRRSRNAIGVERESEEAIVPGKRGRTTSWREGPLLESSFRKR